ncbi:uncharacterized protein LOC34622909 [Cyclospora cayetanensis]|uniref:Uncharacterized protein LOC34622909 n=1 Tax=Cyclospora cayetanensis TaxID=88456 RepID=A0A6P6S3Y9_9EIME|nr:uncharacterized protein LOC34622909 [Cyclospora cayetanensis]
MGDAEFYPEAPPSSASSIPKPQQQPVEEGGEASPSGLLRLRNAESPMHVPCAAQPPPCASLCVFHEAPNSPSLRMIIPCTARECTLQLELGLARVFAHAACRLLCFSDTAVADGDIPGGALLPGRQRILVSAARQLASSELLVEGLDVCAVDIYTHALPPPSLPPSIGPIQAEEASPKSQHSRRHGVEFLRVHALLQAAVGAEQDLVVVALHQVDTRHRHAWAACVAAAFAAAEGQAAAAFQMHLLGPKAFSAASGTNAATAQRSACLTKYEQIVPLDACPHNNQLLLVYVHPSHLHKVTLLSIAKSRLGAYCCRELQQNYTQQWGVSSAALERLREQGEQRRRQEELQQQQQRMDLFFNFSNFFGLANAGEAGSTASAPAVMLSADETSRLRNNTPSGRRPTSPLMGLSSHSKREARRQQRLDRQRLEDRICCNNTCSLQPSRVCSSDSGDAGDYGCGCEVYREVFAYGGVAARLLIGATPVIVACIDLKLSESPLEVCGKSRVCVTCGRQTLQQEESSGALAAGAEGSSELHSSEKGVLAEQRRNAASAWRRQVTLAVQRQQLLTILSDLRFETECGWTSALELKPLLVLGACHRDVYAGAVRQSARDVAAAGALAASEVRPNSAAAGRRRRLVELEDLGVRTCEDRHFFFYRTPARAGNPLLSIVEGGHAAEWRRPAWNRGSAFTDAPYYQREGVITRFWLRWMSFRLLVEAVDMERVKKQCHELRQILPCGVCVSCVFLLQQEGRSLSKLLVDPPLLQLPPVRAFEPMQLKICLSNPHASLPTAYAVYCLSDSGRSIVPLSHVSYWHGAVWRRWEGRGADEQPLGSARQMVQSRGDMQEQQREQQHDMLLHEQQRLQDEARSSARRHDIDSMQATPRLESGPYAVTSEKDLGAVLRRRVRLERWLLMDSLQGFLRGGETRVVSITLNIQEGIYTAHELACGVLVIRLVDSRQDFFCCLAASLMPSLLGAELHPLAMLGQKALLPEASDLSKGSGESSTEEGAAAALKCAPALEVTQEEEGRELKSSACSRGKAEDSSESKPQLPLPKELWWLLMHLYSKTQAAASSAERRRPRNCGGWKGELKRKHHPQDSMTRKGREASSQESLQRAKSSFQNRCTDEDSACSNRPNIAEFLRAFGGNSLSWPSFLSGADTYMQPQRDPHDFSCTAETVGENCDCRAVHGSGSHRCRHEMPERHVRMMPPNAECDQDGLLERDVAFLRACLERGVAIPEGVGLCAALALLEQWGATCCFFPSEFAVQDVQTDNLHLLCRAILLSLPSVHRNAFISLVSALNALLKAATQVMGASIGPAGTDTPNVESHTFQAGVCDSGVGAACGDERICKDNDGATVCVGHCPSEGSCTAAACQQVGEEASKSGGHMRQRARQRVKCLESLCTPELFRHALLLWIGSWLMKGCRPGQRYAVLDHFIAPV